MAIGRGLRLAIAATLVAVTGGCASSRCAPRWGSTATILPSSARVRNAALAALKDPLTWVPAAGAALFLATGTDREVSDWARDETPIFGSNLAADDASDLLRDASIVATLGTALVTPSGTRPLEIGWNKTKGIAVELAAGYATERATVGLKRLTDRPRPDDSDDLSWPSGHASVAAAAALLTRRNLDAIPMDPRARTAAKATATGTAAVVAWARIEAGKHYPSDVLAGYALGNALSAFVHDAFLGPTSACAVSVCAGPVDRGFGANVGFSW